MTEALQPVRPVALVTGAAGGIGSMICVDLQSHGWDVVAADVAGSDLPDGADVVEVDIRSASSCRAAVDHVAARHPRLDLLVNNAGINARGNAEDVPDDVWEAVVDVNLNGTFRMCRAAFPMLTASRGSIVNLSSSGALVAIAGSAIYGVTKAAITHLTRVLAVEWSTHGVRVNAVAPTIVDTAMTADVLGNADYMKAKLASIPLGRLVTTQEVAMAVRWLASHEAQMVTGVTLPVDGGVSVL